MQCKDSYMWSDLAQACIWYTIGISNCETYLSETQCQQCLPNYYLRNNECINIDINDWIVGCLYYNDQWRCVQCSKNYALIDSTCKFSDIVGCRVYKNVQECSICSQGYGLVIDSTGDYCEF